MIYYLPLVLKTYGSARLLGVCLLSPLEYGEVL